MLWLKMKCLHPIQVLLLALAIQGNQAYVSVNGRFLILQRAGIQAQSKTCCLCSRDTGSGMVVVEEGKRRGDHNIESQSRRRLFLASSALALSIRDMVKPVYANDANVYTSDAKYSEKRNTQILVRGKVTIKSGSEIPIDTSISALYITARPSKPDNVPRAILDGSNGKPPPVLAARFPNPVFPFEFELTELDLTGEGASKSAATSISSYWWEDQDLILSGRWDMDGTAATRGPTDLVGRGLVGSRRSTVDLQMGGRGLTGKLVTGKSAK